MNEMKVAEYRKNGTMVHLPPELKVIASAVNAPFPFVVLVPSRQ